MAYPKNMGDKQLFREDFLNAQSVVDNGGTIVGTPTIDKGITLNGTTDWVTYGDTTTYKWMHGAVDPTGFKWTIKFRMKLTTPEPDTLYGVFSTMGVSNADSGMTVFFDDRSSQSRSRTFALLIGNGGSPVVLALGNNDIFPNDTDYHTVVMTYDQSLASNNWLVYIDKVPVGLTDNDKTGNAPSTADSLDSLHIGADGNEGFPIDGGVERVEIYKDVIWTPDEGADDYDNDTYTEVDFSTLPIHLPSISQYNDGLQKTKNIGTFGDFFVVGDGSTLTTFPTVETNPKQFNYDGGDYLKDSTANFQSSDSIGFVSAMIRVDSLASTMVVFSSSDEATAAYYLRLGVLATGAPFFLQNNNGIHDQIDADVTLEIGRYCHVLYTTTGSAYKFYLDGEEAPSYTLKNGTNSGDWLAQVDNRDNVVIGATIRSIGVGEQWNGGIQGVSYGSFEPTPRQARWLHQRALKEFNL